MKYSTAIQQINYPIHQGKPNPAHGNFFIVGSVPVACIDPDTGRSQNYGTEQQAIDAVVAAGATFVQGADCRVVYRVET